MIASVEEAPVSLLPTLSCTLQTAVFDGLKRRQVAAAFGL